ncbi:alpha/beta hydrolase fold domain-containing protein [Novosphingobium sp. FSY-8]|uniref:Alpha/beta hydrolase fold domain-containing protein n=1 Tax=Novosphingobium ovatum TaxID=1908523 RepID=A0ABW9XC91_9SPHN|nr:alpha/beta hydrolase [Novosphingobium ovatum]NBC36158.1 alpha/beta hydrolase fold domain-containing protein [Novosphingobium ovatum]
MSETVEIEPIDQLVAMLRSGGLDFSGSLEQARADFEAMLATFPVAPEWAFAEGQVGGVPAVLIDYPGADAARVLLYMHGGAFISGSAQGYRSLAAGLAQAVGARGVSVNYRLAPEHPFPAAVEDVVAAYRALLADGVAADHIVLAGDSAGGGLVVSVLVALRDAEVALPAAAFAISPWADLRCTADSYASKAAEDPSLTREALVHSAGLYLGGGDAGHPLASPVLADLRGLPPLLIHVGSAEVLMDDAVALARAAGQAGVDVRLEIWPRMVHVWHVFGFMLEQGRRAVADAGAFLRSRMG